MGAFRAAETRSSLDHFLTYRPYYDIIQEIVPLNNKYLVTLTTEVWNDHSFTSPTLVSTTIYV